MSDLGRVVVLNGTPRSGKSSIVEAMQESFPEPWLNLGVDVFCGPVTPPRYRPGIGLRPGGERPDLEPLVARLYAGLYDSVAAHSRLGLDVVVDVGHHDAYSAPLGVLRDAARRLAGLPAFLVGVRCPLEVVLQRRGMTGPAPPPVAAWQEAVHRPGIYDLEVDTSQLSPAECAELVRRRLAAGPPTAWERLAAEG